jgi:hypothetical protein
MVHLRPFTQALLREWILLLGGPVVAAAVIVAALLRNDNLNFGVALTAMLVCIVLGLYRAWVAEYVKHQAVAIYVPGGYKAPVTVATRRWIAPVAIVCAVLSIAMAAAALHLFQSENNSGLSLKIGGFVTTGVSGDSTRVQVMIIAYNSGEPTTARDWAMELDTSTGAISAYHAFGEPFAKRSLDIPHIDAALQQPLGKATEMPGYVSFIVPHVAQSTIDLLYKDPIARIVVTAKDSSGREIRTERGVRDLWLERHEVSPAK